MLPFRSHQAPSNPERKFSAGEATITAAALEQTAIELNKSLPRIDRYRSCTSNFATPESKKWSPNVYFPSRQWFSKVKTADTRGFE
jgi:hypothetical protein